MPLKDRAAREAYKAQWYENNRERLLARQKQYAIDNKEKLSSYYKKPEVKSQVMRNRIKRRLANLPKALEQEANYREINRERLRQWDREYWARGHRKEKTRSAARLRHSREKAVERTLTAKQWSDILAEQQHKCLRCNLVFDETRPPTRDHIIPIVAGGPTSKENIQALCKSCNSRKGSTYK